ncbi:hypothetical protein FOA52_002659 [Chlamydomonas sp. UWO 241]|nr:hypothetical protein FOA52_002659 [Chlamydomonas sp. UWO 241]
MVSLAAAGSSRTVLVVDDLLFNRRIISSMLRKLGFDVLEASNGEQACELYQMQEEQKAHSICAVILDLNMPLLDGWQTASRLRELEIEGSDRAESGQSLEDGTQSAASCSAPGVPLAPGTTTAAAAATCARNRLPVIVCTANETTDAHGRHTLAASRALSAGADIVLPKPMSLAGLQASLDSLLPAWRDVVATAGTGAGTTGAGGETCGPVAARKARSMPRRTPCRGLSLDNLMLQVMQATCL